MEIQLLSLEHLSCFAHREDILYVLVDCNYVSQIQSVQG